MKRAPNQFAKLQIFTSDQIFNLTKENGVKRGETNSFIWGIYNLFGGGPSSSKLPFVKCSFNFYRFCSFAKTTKEKRTIDYLQMNANCAKLNWRAINCKSTLY